MNLQRIDFLDGLRGLAILLVLLFHTYVAHSDLLPYTLNSQNLIFIKYGFFGVQLFFLLSGFVILMTLEKTKNFLTFLYKRWLRLFPALFIASLLIFFTAPLFYERPAGIPSIYSLLPPLLFTENIFLSKFFGFQIPEIEGAFWSLYVEMKFYILFGAAYFLLGKKKAIILLCLCFIYALLYVFYPWHKQNYFIALFTHFGWFASGALSYLFYSEQKIKNFALSILLGALALLTTFKYQNYPPDYLLVGIAVISLFYLTISYKKSRFILANRFFLFLGFISYPLYLIHENMIISSLVKLSKHSPILRNLFVPLIPILIVCLAAYLIAKAEPFLKENIDKKVRSNKLISKILK